MGYSVQEYIVYFFSLLIKKYYLTANCIWYYLKYYLRERGAAEVSSNFNKVADVFFVLRGFYSLYKNRTKFIMTYLNIYIKYNIRKMYYKVVVSDTSRHTGM